MESKPALLFLVSMYLNPRFVSFSPQDYAKFHNLDTTVDQFGGNSSYFWINTEDGSRVQCPIEPRSNLPIVLARKGSMPSEDDDQESDEVTKESEHTKQRKCQCSTCSMMNIQ